MGRPSCRRDECIVVTKRNDISRAGSGDVESTTWKPSQDTTLYLAWDPLTHNFALDCSSDWCFFYDFDDVGIGLDGVQGPFDHQRFHWGLLFRRRSVLLTSGLSLTEYAE